MSKDRQKIIGISVVTVLLGVLIVWFGIIRTQKKISDVDVEVRAVEDQISIYEGKRDAIPGLEAEKKAIEEVVEDFVRILPNDADDKLFELNRVIGQYKDEANINAEALTPIISPVKPGEEEVTAFKRHQYELTMTAHFFDFARLMNLLEANQHFIKVDSFRCYRPVASEQEGEDLTLLAAELRMSTYTYDPPKVVPNP